MAEVITLSLFLAGLVLCLVTEQSLLFALIFGLGCFVGYALYLGRSPRRVRRLLWRGVARVKIILLIFVQIGLLTAIWRACGTIAFITSYGVELISPRYFVLCTFLLCSAVSFLTGTSFGTAGTVGVICMSLSAALGLEPLLTGGAVLSGIFFGDRCSPMSSSAQLVCVITETDIYANIRGMLKTALVPFLLTCLFYGLVSPPAASTVAASQLTAVFDSAFNLHWLTLLPAVLMLVLAACRVNVLLAMAASSLCGLLIAVFVQQTPLGELFYWLLAGYHSSDPAAAALLDGGGLISMVSVSFIVIISSAYSGIFQDTPLLSGCQAWLRRLAGPCTPFGASVVTAILASAISCNQTLATTLTHQLTGSLFPDKSQQALMLEDTAIVISALIPWSIAGAVPIATIGAASGCLLYAVYLYAIPLWNWGTALWRRKV